jgi:hypothetical protein
MVEETPVLTGSNDAEVEGTGEGVEGIATEEEEESKEEEDEVGTASINLNTGI